MRDFRIAAMAYSAIALLYGCTTVERAQHAMRGVFRPLAASAKPAVKAGEQITLVELEQLTYGFADRYLTYIISATEKIARDNAAAVQRRRAHQVRLVQVSAVYDIVTNADPFTRLLDLVLVVTLQSQKWIEEDQAERWFGDRAQPLILASRKAREDIWQIAARAMTTDQLEVLDYLIWEWRQRNPGVEMVSYVRFDDFAAARGKSIIADVKGGGGLLAPVGEATKAVDEARVLAERAFFYAKRLPFLLNWQVRAALDDVIAESEMRELSESLLAAGRMIAQLPEHIAREREALLANLDRAPPVFRSLSSQYRGAIGDTTTLVRALTGLSDASQRTLELLDRVVVANNGDGRPFDIREYGKTLDKLLAALQEATRLANSTALVMEGVEPQRFEVMAKGGSNYAQAMAAGILDAAFWRGVGLIVVFFVMLAIYRVVALRFRGRVRGE
jgi:hypothetical protein